jgi:CBS domain containing-hemolysin-like protein
MDDLLKLAAVFALVLINGLFVAAEFALVSVRPTRIDQLVEQGNRMARVVKRAMADPNRFISASQIGITMASLALGWVAEPTLAALFEPLFENVMGEGARISSHLVAGVLAYFLITLLHIVIGEQVPKMIALQRSEATILATAGPVSWISVPFRPLIALLYWLTGIVLRVFNLQWQGEHHLVYSEDELKMLVTASQESGFLEASEQEMIHRVFGFADIVTEQVMVPRTEMEALQVDATFEEVTQLIISSGHGRYPVYGENLDEILGIFYAKDLYHVLLRERRARFSLLPFLRPPLTVSFTTPLDNLLTQMKRQRTHIAIVRDEYGGTAGMVTLEDVLERIVGDVQDEFESQNDDIQHLSDGQVRVSGLLSLTQLAEGLDLRIDDPFYNTIGGYVFGQLGRRPEVGDEVEVGIHVLRVDALDGLRIDRILITKREHVVQSDPDELQIQDVES